MKKRKSLWLKGMDFFDLRIESVDNELDQISKLVNSQIPIEVIGYFNKYKPIDVDDNRFYEDSEDVGQLRFIIFQKENTSKFVQVGYFYNPIEIISKIETMSDSVWGNLYNKLKIIPIAENEASPYGDIVLSLSQNSIGKIYNILDYQDTLIDDESLIANNIIEYIEGVHIISADEFNRWYMDK
ncbi:MAG: hypothetical protein R2792_06700 [Saprospiraceae bacterium]